MMTAIECALLTSSPPQSVPQVKLLKCVVDGTVVDISFNMAGGLATLTFLEEVRQALVLLKMLVGVACLLCYDNNLLHLQVSCVLEQVRPLSTTCEACFCTACCRYDFSFCSWRHVAMQRACDSDQSRSFPNIFNAGRGFLNI